MKPFAYAVLGLSLSGLAWAAQADELLMEHVASSRGDWVGPTNGVRMERVRSHFGDPAERVPPVGDPPITRWVYDDFTVYFEYERVITAVAHR